MKKHAEKLQRIKKNLDKKTRENVKLACYEMVAEAKRCTPPHEGEERGKNTVTGNMARHWDSSSRLSLTLTDIKVTLFNNVQYASYVDRGHRMAKHFVPWLYVDGTGTIARHQPVPGEPLFGMYVGTKTKYIPPENITEKAKSKFYEVYNRLDGQAVTSTEKTVNKEIK